MSKLDYVTIGIVVVCIAALIFLVYSVINLMGDPKPAPTEQTTEQPADDFYEDGDTYTYDDEGEVITDDALTPGADSTQSEYKDTSTDSADGTGQQTNFQEEDTDDDYVAEEPGESSAFSDTRSGEYLVLAGSYRYRYNAEEEVGRLQKLGYNRAEVTLFNRGTYATVMVDRFGNLSDARNLARELQSQHGVEAYVHEKRRQER